ncbi:unnamed protein product, partial [marine sediment metagenome]
RIKQEKFHALLFTYLGGLLYAKVGFSYDKVSVICHI